MSIHFSRSPHGVIYSFNYLIFTTLWGNYPIINWDQRSSPLNGVNKYIRLEKIHYFDHD